MTASALYDEDVEAALIGSLLEDASKIEQIVPIISPEAFYRKENHILFATILEETKANRRIDSVSIKSALGDERLREVGGISYIGSLIERLPTNPDPVSYAKIIKDKYILRLTASLADDLKNSAIEGQDRKVRAKILDRIRTLDKADDENDALSRVKQSLDDIDRVRKAGVDLLTGYTQLDNMIGGLRRGLLTVLGARTSHGKTTIACNISLYNLLKNPACKVLFNAFENIDQIATRISAIKSGIPLSCFLKPHDLSEERYLDVVNALYDVGQFKSRLKIVRGESIAGIRSICDEFKPDIIIWDFLQRFAHRYDLSSHGTLAHEVGGAVSDLQDIAIDKKSHVICLSQIRRSIEDYQRAFSKTVEYRPPDISELKESGDIENYADNVLLAWWPWRDTVSDKLSPNDYRILLRKNKLGPLGEVSVRIDVETLKISDWQKK